MAKKPLTERPDWLEPLADPKSELILRAAFDVFQEQGLHAATMLDVAKRARVSKETLYARFDSKEGLFYAIIAWGTRQCALDVEGLAQAPIADPIAELRRFTVELMASYMHPESLACYRLAISESGRNPEIGRAFDELGCESSEGVIERIFDALKEKGLIENAPNEELEHSLLGLMRGNYHHGALTGTLPIPDREEMERRANRAVDLWLRAYAPRAQARIASAA